MSSFKPGLSSEEFGILALSNPFEWPNEPDVTGVNFFLTTKDCYIWPIIIGNFLNSAAKEHGLEYIQIDGVRNQIITDFGFKIDRYFNKMLDITGKRDVRNMITLDDERDFRRWRRQRSAQFASKFGNTGEIKKALGKHLKGLAVADLDSQQFKLVEGMEEDGLVFDPFVEPTTAGVILALGLVPHSFTKRTKDGDEHYRKIKAMLWEFEETRTPVSREYSFHFLMDKAILELKKVVTKWAVESNPNQDSNDKR